MYCIDFYIASFVSHANCCADTLNFSVFIATTSCLCAIVVIAIAIAIVIMAVIIFWYWHLIFDVLLFFALSLFFCASHTFCLFLTSLILSVSFYFESIRNLISKVPINFRNNFFTRNRVARIELNGSAAELQKMKMFSLHFHLLRKRKKYLQIKWKCEMSWGTEKQTFIYGIAIEKKNTRTSSEETQKSVTQLNWVRVLDCMGARKRERERELKPHLFELHEENVCVRMSVWPIENNGVQYFPSACFHFVFLRSLSQ